MEWYFLLALSEKILALKFTGIFSAQDVLGAL